MSLCWHGSLLQAVQPDIVVIELRKASTEQTILEEAQILN